MQDSSDFYRKRDTLKTAAYKAGIEIRGSLRDGNQLQTSVSEVTIRSGTLDDSYPEWHPAPDSFLGMIRLFIYREITGNSYRALAQYQELTDAFGLDHIPDDLCSLKRGVIASTTMSSNS